jgi:hypothetical protein
MGSAIYRIVPYQDGWGVAHDGSTTGPYVNKEAAFEASAGAASIAKVLFFVFIVIFLIFLVLGIMAGETLFR